MRVGGASALSWKGDQKWSSFAGWGFFILGLEIGDRG